MRASSYGYAVLALGGLFGVSSLLVAFPTVAGVVFGVLIAVALVHAVALFFEELLQ